MQKLISFFAFNDVPLHEIQDSGTQFNGLGWDWVAEPDGWVMVCPDDKFVFICRYLAEWSAPGVPTLSLAVIRKACGILNWIAGGWPIGLADVAPLIHMRTAGEAMAARLVTVPPDAFGKNLTQCCRSVILLGFLFLFMGQETECMFVFWSTCIMGIFGPY